MKRSIQETQDRFDELSDEYDDTRSEVHHRAVDIVVEWARKLATSDMIAVDLGAGTGMVSLPLASYVKTMYALDISPDMLRQLEQKADQQGVDNIRTARGRFREPDMDRTLPSVDLVVSNFAMHHLNNREKEEAVDVMRSLLTRHDSDGGYVVLGDVILFEELTDPEEHFDPDVDDPATIETLTDLFRGGGFSRIETREISPASGVVIFEYQGTNTERS